ncbi:hypothetical protein [Solibacillus sp. FSL H8-0538]|uniref:hypothetical protein n=1 Tax=Solibacillus sp. FSL H8-0538 TaxID=2921400 RepID=UPI0030F77800
MFTNKHVARSVERQHLKSARKFYHAMADINLELAKVHRSIERQIDKSHYTAATSFVDQYISYTTIWNMKFVYNLENPEVVLMQILHLDYIFKREEADAFLKERQILAEQHLSFKELKPYKDEQIEARIEKMAQYIAEF